jgi:hypothetical protein
MLTASNMTNLDDLEQLLASIDIAGWSPAIDHVRGASVFGVASMDAVRRSTEDRVQTVGLWWEDADTLWLSFARVDEFEAAAEFRSHDVDDGRLRSAIIAVMSGGFTVKRHSRHRGVLKLLGHDAGEAVLDMTNDRRSKRTAP